MLPIIIELNNLSRKFVVDEIPKIEKLLEEIYSDVVYVYPPFPADKEIKSFSKLFVSIGKIKGGNIYEKFLFVVKFTRGDKEFEAEITEKFPTKKEIKEDFALYLLKNLKHKLLQDKTALKKE
jgi:hypothetical protein